MKVSLRDWSIYLAIFAIGFVAVFGAAASVGAQVVDRGNMVLSASTTPDPGPSGGVISYAISIKNDSTVTAKGVSVTVQLPAGSQFVKCASSAKGFLCDSASPTAVTAILPKISAHATGKFTVTANAPTVSSKTVLPLFVHAHVDRAVGGEEPRDD